MLRKLAILLCVTVVITTANPIVFTKIYTLKPRNIKLFLVEPIKHGYELKKSVLELERTNDGKAVVTKNQPQFQISSILYGKQKNIKPITEDREPEPPYDSRVVEVKNPEVEIKKVEVDDVSDSKVVEVKNPEVEIKKVEVDDVSDSKVVEVKNPEVEIKKVEVDDVSDSKVVEVKNPEVEIKKVEVDDVSDSKVVEVKNPEVEIKRVEVDDENLEHGEEKIKVREDGHKYKNIDLEQTDDVEYKEIKPDDIEFDDVNLENREAKVEVRQNRPRYKNVQVVPTGDRVEYKEIKPEFVKTEIDVKNRQPKYKKTRIEYGNLKPEFKQYKRTDLEPRYKKTDDIEISKVESEFKNSETEYKNFETRYENTETEYQDLKPDLKTDEISEHEEDKNPDIHSEVGVKNTKVEYEKPERKEVVVEVTKQQKKIVCC